MEYESVSRKLGYSHTVPKFLMGIVSPWSVPAPPPTSLRCISITKQSISLFFTLECLLACLALLFKTVHYGKQFSNRW